MRIIDLTMELADGTQIHPAHARCVVIEFASRAVIATRCSWSSPRLPRAGSVYEMAAPNAAAKLRG
jgi:hypothetical protein